ncbi:MAG: oligoendopeptidase F [Chloroflexota bacterium]|nr:oligoendopeptidase F [Chloroflexota bacterium]
MAVALPKRSELDAKYTWDLGSIFLGNEQWQAKAEEVRAMLPGLDEYKGHLGDSAERLLGYFKLAERINVPMMQLLVYANHMHDSDTTNQETAALRDQARGMFASVAAALSFAEPELLTIPQETIERYMQEEPELQVYSHYFDMLRRKADHVRSPEVEQVLAMASDVLDTPRTAHGTLADSDLDYGSVDTGEGSLQVAGGTIQALLRNPNIEVRRTAWEQYADGFLTVKNTFASLLSGGVKKDVFLARAHNYNTAVEAALAQNFIPREVYDNMLNTARRKLPVWHRYWSVRRRILGLDMLHPYDVFAPLAKEQPRLAFEEAVDMICEGMNPLGGDYCDPMRKGLLEQRWVDVYPNVGKRSGAYSGGSFGTNPFILMSYTNDLESMSTLAHELGHSMHSYLTRANQPMVYARYGMFVAETASNFNQALVRAHLLKKNDDPQFQISVIEEAMYNFHRYFFIMPILARFELEIHTRVENGQALTADSLIELMADMFTEGYGPEVEVDRQRVGITWAQFPIHMYLNFYVYQYATGISAANALAANVLEKGQSAAEDYKRFLKAGSSTYPLDALKMAGVDMSTPEPVERAFDILEGFVDRLERLAL